MADRAHRAGSLTYDPASDLAARHPEWVLGRADLGGVITEVLCWVRKVILIDRTCSAAVQRSSLAHAVAHLDLGHTVTAGGYFENREEVRADRLAAGRLISFAELADAAVWAADRDELAHELEVDVPMLRVREGLLSASEVRRLRRVRAGAVRVD